MLAHTGCDGLLIGRGAMGNPWIFSQVRALQAGENPISPDIQARVQTALRHARMMTEWKGPFVAAREMRKHVAWYVSGLKGAAKMRVAANAAQTMRELEDALRRFADAAHDGEEISS
jgi:tRNA-dihydrouridine synthase